MLTSLEALCLQFLNQTQAKLYIYIYNLNHYKYKLSYNYAGKLVNLYNYIGLTQIIMRMAIYTRNYLQLKDNFGIM